MGSTNMTNKFYKFSKIVIISKNIYIIFPYVPKNFLSGNVSTKSKYWTVF